MNVVKLSISNYRGIRAGELFFDGHTLLIGMNNVGKSTICEALELVLGLDRLKRFPPVEEFDFYNSDYLDSAAEPPVPRPIEIEVVLTELSEELAKKCFDRLERWHASEKRVLGEGEAALADGKNVRECLRIKTIARYNVDEDEFEAKSIFCSGPLHADGSPYEVPRHIRQLFGFFYLRALRTGSRALSLERGSLLDIILERQNVRTGIWENAIQQLRGLTPPIDAGAIDLGPILDNIERRLGQYIPLNTTGGRATQLFVSQLRREHLRKTISFFLRTAEDQIPVPRPPLQTPSSPTISALLHTELV
jgi:putative ATP-dependent endonuclease of OLD family